MCRLIFSGVLITLAMLLNACGSDKSSGAKSSAVALNASSSFTISSSSSAAAQSSNDTLSSSTASSLSALSAEGLRPSILPKSPSDLSSLRPPLL